MGVPLAFCRRRVRLLDQSMLAAGPVSELLAGVVHLWCLEQTVSSFDRLKIFALDGELLWMFHLSVSLRLVLLAGRSPDRASRCFVCLSTQ